MPHRRRGILASPPIAREVEKLRGLKFEHPVPVDFLSETAFVEKLAIASKKLSTREKEQISRSERQLRAVGLLPGNVDLLDAERSLQQSGVLAFYDPDTKRATVRGRQLSPAAKVTLAHELTHALQDQHFDLNKLERTADRKHASAPLTALIEGDAVRVQHLYADELPSAERAEYEQSLKTSASAALAEAHSGGVPDSLVVLSQTPYTLGPAMLQVVKADEGARAVDGLFREPPTTDSSYLTPTTLVDGTKTTKVGRPALQSGEAADGKPDVFGAFALYVMLAARSDPVAALRVADGWGGDSMVTFKRGGTTCVRASFTGRTVDAGTAIHDALVQWAAQSPAGTADVRREGALATLTACDPGSASGVPPDRSLAALTVAAVRNTLFATLAEQGVSVKVADCTANGVVADPAFGPVLDAAVADPNATPGADVLAPLQQSVLTIASKCARQH